MMAVYTALKERGHKVTAASYGSALEQFRRMGAHTIETLPEIKMVGEDGRFNLLRSAAGSAGTPLDIAKAFMKERAYIKRSGVDAVISDSRLSTVLAGAQSKVPVFYVSNQTEFKLPESVTDEAKNRFLKYFKQAKLAPELIRGIIDRPLSIPHGFSDRLLIPDFPPPEAVCLPLLDKGFENRKKTYFTGPMSMLCFSPKIKPAKWETRKKKVLVTLGGQEFRKGLLGRLIRESLKCKEYDFIFTSKFIEKDSDEKNVHLRSFLPEIYPYMKAADILVMPAGHSTIMESILLAKPSIIIPDSGQPEQESNARAYQKLGFGKRLPTDRVKRLGSVLNSIKKNYKKYSKRLSPLALEASDGLNGARNTAEMAEGFVQRMGY